MKIEAAISEKIARELIASTSFPMTKTQKVKVMLGKRFPISHIEDMVESTIQRNMDRQGFVGFNFDVKAKVNGKGVSSEDGRTEYEVEVSVVIDVNKKFGEIDSSIPPVMSFS